MAQSQTFFLHADLAGYVQAITDSAGQLAAKSEQEPFELTNQASSVLADETHEFTGKPEDDTGLYCYGARVLRP